MKSDFGHPRVIVTETRDWPEQAALHFLTTARDAVAHRGAFHVVVPGGSTPRQAFAHVVAHAGANDPCWERTHLYFGDERLVAPDHPDSNFRMIREALLDQAPIPAEQVHRIPGVLEA